jgi:predicted permease
MLELGGIEQAKEHVRTARPGAFLEELARDLDYTFRIFRKQPAFVLVVVLTLTLGIGANTALFTLMNAMMLKSLPVREPDRLVEIRSGRRVNFSNPIWEQIRDRRELFDGAIAYSTERHNLASGGETHFIDAIHVNGNYFGTLGIPAAIGRTFTEADDRRGCGEDGHIAVISHSFWQSHYGGSPDVLGKSLSLDGRQFTIVGVTGSGFFGVRVGQSFDVATPLCASDYLEDRGRAWLRLVGRLKPGMRLDDAEKGLRAAQAAIRDATRPAGGPAGLAGRNYLADPFQLLPAGTGTSFLRDRYVQPLVVLMALAGLVLLVTCGNIASLLLARTTARTREIAIRISLGASRSRLIRQLLIESVTLSLLGASMGVLFAPAASRWFLREIPPGAATRLFLDVGLDWRVLTFTIAAGIITGLIFGIVPAIRTTRGGPSEILAEFTTHATTSRRVVGAGKWLVSLQMTASLVLLFGASLFLRSYWRLGTADHGFDSTHVLLLITGARDGFNASGADFPEYSSVIEAVRAVPGVQSAAYSFTVPVGESQGLLNIRTEPNGSTPREIDVWMNTVSPDYFKTFGTPLIAGRDFDSHDRRTDPAAIVNQAFVRELLPTGNPIGKQFQVRSPHGWTSIKVVGVVGNTKYLTLRETVPPTVYTPEEPKTYASGVISVKTSGAAIASAPAIVNAIGAANKKLPLTVRTFQSVVDESMAQERLMATLSIFFGVLALIIAGVGLEGMVSYSVTRRRSEIGIRSALGATSNSLLALMMHDVLSMTACGAVLGSFCGLAAARWIASMLYEIAPSDPITLGISVVTLVLVALIAGYIPARRAARIDPMQCLRS